MAKIIFHTPHLHQVGIPVVGTNILNPNFPVYIYSSEDFILSVESGTLMVDNTATEHVTMTISKLPCFEVQDKFPWNSSLTASFCPLPLITKLEYEVSDDFIEPKYIKFRRLESLSNYDLSEIEYKGNIYPAMRNKEQ